MDGVTLSPPSATQLLQLSSADARYGGGPPPPWPRPARRSPGRLAPLPLPLLLAVVVLGVTLLGLEGLRGGDRWGTRLAIEPPPPRQATAPKPPAKGPPPAPRPAAQQRLTPRQFEDREERRAAMNKVLMSVATAGILTSGALDVQVVSERKRLARLGREVAPAPVERLAPTAPEEARPPIAPSLDAPDVAIGGGGREGGARPWPDFASLERPYMLLTVPILMVVASSLLLSLSAPQKQWWSLWNRRRPDDVTQVIVDPSPIVEPPPHDAPRAKSKPLPLADTPVEWGYVPKQGELFSIVSGVALTLSLQAAGQIPQQGGIDYLIPFCYGTALATLYDAVCKTAVMRSEQLRRSMRVVVTGSTRGVGKALAREFLRRGDQVVVTSRSQAAVDRTVEELRAEVPGGIVVGIATDVSNGAEVRTLADYAVKQFGGVDLWINNAGTISQKKDKLTELSQAEILTVVQTNLVGSLLCTQTALRLMQQQGYGHIFNMDGAGATGTATPLYATYGSTKAALVQLTKSLCEESSGSGVGVHLLSPGMVITDLLLEGASPENLRAFNVLAELPENVSAWLVPRIRATQGTGQYIRYLTNLRVIGRLLTFPFRWDRFFDKDGKPTYKPEAERMQTQETPLSTAIEIQTLTVIYALSMASLFWTIPGDWVAI
eukprot:EG_transcript_2317